MSKSNITFQVSLDHDNSKLVTANLNAVNRSKLFADIIGGYPDVDSIPFPAQFNDVLTLYICYTNDSSSLHYQMLISNVNKTISMKRMYELCHYIDDEVLFKLLMSILLNNYKCSYDQVINDLNSNIQRDICLCLPYCYVVEPWLSDDNFFKIWYTINNGNVITVGNHHYRSYCLLKRSPVKFISTCKPIDNNKKRKFKLHGLVKHWYSDAGVIKQEYYHMGKLHGESKTWYSSDSNQLKLSCTYYHGGKVGTSKSWHIGGQLEHEFHYHSNVKDSEARQGKRGRGGRRDIKTGIWREWYTNGNLSNETTYVNNLIHGYQKAWYPNNVPQYCGYYNNHNPIRYEYYQRDGKLYSCQHYDANGQLHQIDYYCTSQDQSSGQSSNQLIKRECYDKDKRRKTENYKDGVLVSWEFNNK